MTVTIRSGIPVDQRTKAALLYWQAFSAKLGLLLGPEEKALAFLTHILNPDFAIGAVDAQGELVGLAGFKTTDGALVGGRVRDLQRTYGWFGGIWRGLLLSLLVRPLAEGVLLMDGICVDEKGRGQGVGTLLLAEIKAEARQRDCQSVRLDVIDTNPRAEALYRREGFTGSKRVHLGPLRHLFGFHSSLQMQYILR
jgi:ribosomal protein S18 acetylase RimI-like enzyme